MNISCIGCGYVGLVVGTCLADLGNEVICVDVDGRKIAKLRKGVIPIYEPGLQDMLHRNVKEKRLSFSTDMKKAIKSSQVIFITVGTPPGQNHEADLTSVKKVAREIGRHMDDYKVIVNKSTVPVGTAKEVIKNIKKYQKGSIEFDVVSNPEFLREGEAVKDFTNPDRIVIGVNSPRPRAIMESIYKGIARADKPILFTNTLSAEMIKYASNAMLATRVSFMNELAALCEKVGADIKQVAVGMGLDDRIGPRFLQAGVGYGGSCLPKDVRALVQIMKLHNVKSNIIDAVDDVNRRQRRLVVRKLKKLLPDIKGKSVAVWGLAYKPKTDDMREAPAITVVEELQKLGAKIRAFDPEAEPRAKKILKKVKFFNNPFKALTGCHALVILTEWNEFRELDKEKIKRLLKMPNVVDGRNIYDPDEMRQKGFNYQGVGRS
ncbi:MAG: UDP-glucose dehydrogenase family protein [Candidatus Brocadiales bacterium]